VSQEPDTRVRIVQCLCPRRHAIIAVAYTPAEITDDDVVEGLKSQIKSMIFSGVLDSWCGICGATAWHFEIGQTPFATMDEAKPHLQALEAENLRARNFLRAQGN
jgi:hypothetical protein